nr:hypothetical protein [Tanacetum cinerariifolium]
MESTCYYRSSDQGLVHTLALMANSNNPYAFPAPHQDQPSFNQNYVQQPMPNPKDITDPTTAMNMALALMAKAFKLNYSTPTNNNQRISSNPRNRQIAQPGMNIGQDRQMQMVGGNGKNQFRQYAGQNVGNMNGYNDVQNNGLIGVPGNANQNLNGNGNLVAARAEGNAAWQNGNQIRCYNCRGVADLDDIEKVNANCILMANLQQASSSAGFESRPPMLNKENYVPWSSCLLHYAKSIPNGKLIHNSIINGPYVRRMISEPGDTNREVPVSETFHEQTDDELTKKELKQIEADDQAIQTILLGLPEDIYAAVDSCETAQEIWFTSNEGESIESYYHHFLKLMNDLKQNKHFPEKITSNLKFLNNLQPEWSRHVTIVHQTKDLHTADYTQLYDFLKYNQKEVIQNAVQNPRVQNIGNQNGLISVQGNGNQNQIGNGNLVAARAEGNAAWQNGNQIRCYNCRGVGHFARNCIVRPRRKDAAFLQTQLLIAQKEEAGIQLQAEEFDLMAAAADLDEIKEVNANCILMANLQQASTSGTQSDKSPIYDSDGSAEVHEYENCYDNEIFNMFTQEEQYTELLEPIPEQHQVPHNDNNVISEVTSVEQIGKQ